MISTDKYTKILVSLVVVLVIVCFLCVVLIFRVRDNRYPDFPEKVKTDTVFVSRFFEPDTELKFDEFPETVFFFFSDSIPVKDIQVIKDTVYIETSSGTFDYNAQFLAQYPNAPKFIQMSLDKNLNLTFLNTQGKIYQEQYVINPEIYRYLYTDHLTSEKKSFWKRWTPFVQFQIRPINTLLDLDLGLKYKTSRMQYEFGINGFYYQPLPKHFGADLFLRVRYEF